MFFFIYINLKNYISYFRTEIVHVWKDRNIFNNGSTNSAQMILDSVNYVKETVCNITAQPSKLVTDWVTDSMAPSYWKPNIDIVVSYFIFSFILYAFD